MKFMMMMNGSLQGAKEVGIMTWPPEDIQAHMAFMQRFNKELVQSGEFVDAQGLDWPDKAKLVKAGKDGSPVTDGPFAESKEFLIGFWVIDVETPERAYELAAKASMAPGKGGVPMHMPIEVRQVMGAPPPAE